ncbi:T9SS type A sorting domain-containing protein [Crocinitomix algicola]|uniref:T9SS type A sorting domain-containing protein n=1 Tax=Crocinitomix algicola TaxID=1740263 RepID=UPI0008354129|nr:T9SS type A sorting domain-containing protein [Crocinitomix algicola]
MKNILSYILFGLFVSPNLFAADVEAMVVNADEDEANGQIDLTLNAGVAPFTFSWVGPDGFTSTDEDLSDLLPGIYTVTVQDKFCGIATLEVEVEEEPKTHANIEEAVLDDLSLYPNPTTGFFVIQTPLDVEVVVYNVFGSIIVQGYNKKQIDLTGQSSGIYLVQIKSDQGTITRKLALQ